METITHASVFSGIGGPEVAAAMLGWENAFHCEINPFGRAVLEYWFPESKSYEDITKTSFKEWRGRIDVLTGGFPCQPFSYAGKRGGREDERYLWPQMLRVVDEVRPTWVVGENVAGITTMVEGWVLSDLGSDSSLFPEGDDVHRYELERTFTIERICGDLERLGYSVQPVLIPAAAVGAPHRRDRVFIIAHSEGEQGRPQPGQSRDRREEQIHPGRGGREDGCGASPDTECGGSGEIQTEVHAGFADGDQPFCDGCVRSSSNATGHGRNGCAVDNGEERCSGSDEKRTSQKGADRVGLRCFAGVPCEQWTSSDTEDMQRNGGCIGHEREPGGEPTAQSGDGGRENMPTADSDRQGREESQFSGWGEDRKEEGAGVHDRTERLGCDGNPSNTEGEQYGEPEPGERENSGRQEGASGGSRCKSLAGLLPENRWREFTTVSPVHRGNDGLPFNVDNLTIPFAKWRTESLKAYGNAIVPQVMYEIFRAIETVEHNKRI